MKHLLKIYTLIFVSIIVAILYMYISLEKTEVRLTDNIKKLFISQAKEFASNINSSVKDSIEDNIYTTLKYNLKLRRKFADSLATIATDSYKYIYILYRDKKGNYRFLIDGSKGDDKGDFDEKLNVDKNIWDKSYNTQVVQLISNNRYDGLWLSYIKPIIIKGKTEAIIGIDFSPKLPKDISLAINPLHDIFIYIFIAVLIMLLILLYQTFLHFKTKKESITDPLTKAYNRNYLRELLNKINISKYQIIMLDIDHFKRVNDSYGHDIGDNILRDIASIIKSEIRGNDIFIRFGGEEFLLFIYKENSELRFANKVANRIKDKIQNQNFIYDSISINITMSMGISCQPEHFKSISDALKYADEMLYIAKREGRNKIVSSYIEKEKNSIKDTKLHINEIKDAVENNRIICYYQAIFDTNTKEIVKYEALVRIKSKKDSSIISPADFLSIIMHTTIYNQMTKKVLEIVFSTIKSNQISISVNLNFSDILNNDIFQIVINELEQNKSLASWLIIELLEYEPLEEQEALKNKIDMIKSYGVKIAIDDFGSGFANYGVFQSLPIDIIKIDGSLIKNIDKSKISQKIVKSIVVLTNELNIETIAEFVHKKEVLKITESLGVTHLQGFYLAEPAPELYTSHS